MSRLRARCPDCRTLTAVAVGPEYECHSCGRQFAAGLVRVPRAWGEGGQAMERAAHLALPYPETGVVEEETLAAQSAALAADLPERPLVLGGCCCAHVGAVEGLAVRPGGRLAVVWLDAHGDLNTVESSPTGNLWATPLRLLVDSGAVVAEDVALVGARNLDPPELEFMAAHGIDDDLGRALAGVDRVYVAVDTDVLRPGELAMFMPEPGGPTLDEVEATLRRVAALTPVAGAGITAFLDDPANQPALARLAAAALQPVTR